MKIYIPLESLDKLITTIHQHHKDDEDLWKLHGELEVVSNLADAARDDGRDPIIEINADYFERANKKIA
jgi:hypothetical protein